MQMPQPRSSKSKRHIRRERRRLGRFVVFSEILTDLTPKPLFEKTPSSGANLHRRRPNAEPTA